MLFIIFASIAFVSASTYTLSVTPLNNQEYCYDIVGDCYLATGGISASTTDKITFTYDNSEANFGKIGLHKIAIGDITDNVDYTLDFDYPNTNHPILLYFGDASSNSYIGLNYMFTKSICQGNAKFSFRKNGKSVKINAYRGPFEFFIDPNDTFIDYMTFDYSNFLTNSDNENKDICLSIYEKPTNDGYENNVKYARYEKVIISSDNVTNFRNLIVSDYTNKTYVKPVYTLTPAISSIDWSGDKILYLQLSKDKNGNIKPQSDPYAFGGIEHLDCNGTFIPLLATTTYITNPTYSSCRYINPSSEHFNIEFDIEDTVYTTQSYNFSASSNSNLLLSYKKGSRAEGTYERELSNIIDIEISQNVKSNESISSIKKDSEFSLVIANDNVKLTPLSGLIKAQHNCNDYDYLYDISNFIFGIFKISNNNLVKSIIAAKFVTGEITSINYENNLFSAVMESTTKKMIYVPSYFMTPDLYLGGPEIMGIVFFVFIFAITLATLVLVAITQKKNKKANHLNI